MGNSTATEKIFRQADDDEDGRLNLQELMQIEHIDQLLSPLMLFRLDVDREGGLTKDEFAKLLQLLQESAAKHPDADEKEGKEGKEGKEKEGKEGKEGKEVRDGLMSLLNFKKRHASKAVEEAPSSDDRLSRRSLSGASVRSPSSSALPLPDLSSSSLPPLTSSSQVVVSLDERIATQLELDRDHETPMIIGGSLAHPTAGVEAGDASEAEQQKRDYCHKLFGTHQGRQEFVSWLWRLADMHRHERVGPEELQLVLEALRHDGINLSYLSFYPNTATPLGSESETEGTSSSSDDDDDPDMPKRRPFSSSSSSSSSSTSSHSSIIEYKRFRAIPMDSPTPDRIPAILVLFERHHVTHLVRLCQKQTYDAQPFAERGVCVVPLLVGFPDQEIPTPEFLEQWRAVLKQAKRKHGAVAVHGLTGGSRACVLTAVSLIELGMDPPAAIKLVRKRRPGAFNARQELWLRRFKKVHYKNPLGPDLSSSSEGAHPGGPGTQLDHATVDRIIAEFDTSGSGYLSKEEFMVFANLIVHAYKAVGEGRHAIGKYLVGEKLGEGSVGTVRVATHLESGEKKAIKIIPRGRVLDMSRLDVEAKAMMMLRHPNVVHLCEVLETDDNVFFVMDLCSGGSLSDYLALRPCGEPLARTYFRQLVQGVLYCHSQGVAHRDLKVENLLLDHDGHLKITDFGQAMIFPEDWDVCNTSVVGTAYHLTPEQIEGQGYSGEKKDTWSVGIILFHLIVGRPPFWTTNMPQLLQDIKDVHYEAPPDLLSPEVTQLIGLLLVRDPEARLPLHNALAHPWMQGPAEEPELSIYTFPLGDLAGLFGDRTTTVHDMVRQWEAHWKNTLHKAQIVGNPVHLANPFDHAPPDSISRCHCFSPEQDGLKFTLSLCAVSSPSPPSASSASSTSAPNSPGLQVPDSLSPQSIRPANLVEGRVSPGHHARLSPPRSSSCSPAFMSSAAFQNSPVQGTPSEIFPHGLLLRFDLYSGSVWNFFKTIHNLHHSLETLQHPFPAVASKVPRRRKKEALPGHPSRSRPSSPHQRSTDAGVERIPINQPPTRQDSKKDFHASRKDLHSHTDIVFELVSSGKVSVEEKSDGLSSAKHRTHSPSRSRSRKPRDADDYVVALTHRLHEQEEITRSLQKLVQQQDDAIKQLQRHVDTLKTDMFRMQSYQSQMMAQDLEKNP